ncbi:RICIN domain-containing protein [Telmatocola sphagniphila]|uniref:RICIN domain-containing protein n=1 Tax=Telmatocola sphagniphila TaxID=1123043 RepID=A0A8E6EZL9_9BACT|nr:RICIN domain-containing protein [Telmatocola sphagniphila]QVL33611.1 RICIN domain-containing protein [Telmatocola sphagniphila]
MLKSKWFFGFALLSLFALLGSQAKAADEKYFKIVHAETKKVLALTDNSEEAGARCVLAKDDGSEAQQWSLVKDGEYLKIVNRKSGKVLDVNEASSDDGAEIIQWDAKDDDFDNQRWSWVGKGMAKQLKSKSSGKVLDISEETKVVQKTADDKNKKQLWEAVEVKAKK